jgi:hypothetical protein
MLGTLRHGRPGPEGGCVMRSFVLFSAVCAFATLGMAGCPPTPPTPPGPDAGLDTAPPPPPPTPTMDSAPTPIPPVDAAPAPVVDSGPTPPPPSTDPCVNACNQMNAVGCPQQADCAKVLANVQALRTNQNPAKKNAPLQCSDLVGVKSSADVKANGWACGATKK